MTNSLPLEELEGLYSSLSAEERDELLQCLLVAASMGGDVVIERVEESLLICAGKRFIAEVTREG